MSPLAAAQLLPAAAPAPPALAGSGAEQAMHRLGAFADPRWQPRTDHEDDCDGIRHRVGDHFLYGVMDVDEAAFGPGPLALQRATEAAYRRIFALLDRRGFPRLWRAWNFLADINRVVDGLERYRQFNVGRHDAFVGSGRMARGNVPAACALGTAGGPLTIAFLAGRSAPVPLENPRQVSAYDYPPGYGPRSPTFSRAVLAYPPGHELLFISGTASIVGHRTVHAGDIAGQARETITNIESLLDAANARSPGPPFRAAELRLRAYIRHAADHDRVRTMLSRHFSGNASIDCLHADICRADLLLEVEAMAAHSLERP